MYEGRWKITTLFDVITLNIGLDNLMKTILIVFDAEPL